MFDILIVTFQLKLVFKKISIRDTKMFTDKAPPPLSGGRVTEDYFTSQVVFPMDMQLVA